MLAMKRLLPLLLVPLAIAGPAAAHGVGPPHVEPGWTLDPAVTIPLAVSLVLYALGAGRLLARGGPGRPTRVRGALLFTGGWLALAGAVVSPLHELGERSFAAHMVEHELLMLVAAPLLVLARPLSVMLWAFPGMARKGLGAASRDGVVRGAWRRLTESWTATLLQITALWIWHAPALFDRALDHPAWHLAQHLSFLITALLFWSAMFEAKRGERALGGPVLCLFTTSVVGGALGALMALSQSPWFARYAELGMAPFGLTPVEDQQLAGLLMWIPGGLVHAGAALVLVGRALVSSGDPYEARQASRP
ncbi:MAG: cytochrome c oxidase assembly protein [Caulobacter sp.]|nr:cytochrome c oxidase assembly protein [Caulobacter sp.]